jgi:hypothetical protein
MTHMEYCYWFDTIVGSLYIIIVVIATIGCIIQEGITK